MLLHTGHSRTLLLFSCQWSADFILTPIWYETFRIYMYFIFSLETIFEGSCCFFYHFKVQISYTNFNVSNFLLSESLLKNCLKKLFSFLYTYNCNVCEVFKKGHISWYSIQALYTQTWFACLRILDNCRKVHSFSYDRLEILDSLAAVKLCSNLLLIAMNKKVLMWERGSI